MKRKGFTLVELIIVIAVIGVLAAILIPVFANVIEKSNKASPLSDSRNAVTRLYSDLVDGTGTGLIDTLVFTAKGRKVYVFGFKTVGGELVSFCGDGYPYSGTTASDLSDTVTNTVIPD